MTQKWRAGAALESWETWSPASGEGLEELGGSQRSRAAVHSGHQAAGQPGAGQLQDTKAGAVAARPTTGCLRAGQGSFCMGRLCLACLELGWPETQSLMRLGVSE